MKRLTLHTLGLAAVLGVGLLMAPAADARGYRGGIRGGGWHGGGGGWGWGGAVAVPWVGEYAPYDDDGYDYDYAPEGVYFWGGGHSAYRRGGHYHYRGGRVVYHHDRRHR